MVLHKKIFLDDTCSRIMYHTQVAFICSGEMCDVYFKKEERGRESKCGKISAIDCFLDNPPSLSCLFIPVLKFWASCFPLLREASISFSSATFSYPAPQLLRWNTLYYRLWTWESNLGLIYNNAALFITFISSLDWIGQRYLSLYSWKNYLNFIRISFICKNEDNCYLWKLHVVTYKLPGTE